MSTQITEQADPVSDLLAMCSRSGLKTWSLQGQTLIPVVQGGMGIGVSAGSLAGAVARQGGVGTISAVDLRRLHPDLMALTAHLDKEPDAKATIEAANLEALSREISKARELSLGHGKIAVNIMKAVGQYQAYVEKALECGVDAVVVGAGLPLDLPELAKNYPNAALIPILSDARGVQLLVRKWEKKGRLPDAIVIEHPRLAGGHLGAAKVADLQDTRFDFDVVLPQVLEFFKASGLEGKIPLIAAGGISSREDIARLQALGAAAVQLGTAFAVTQECDAALALCWESLVRVEALLHHEAVPLRERYAQYLRSQDQKIRLLNSDCVGIKSKVDPRQQTTTEFCSHMLNNLMCAFPKRYRRRKGGQMQPLKHALSTHLAAIFENHGIPLKQPTRSPRKKTIARRVSDIVEKALRFKTFDLAELERRSTK